MPETNLRMLAEMTDTEVIQEMSAEMINLQRETYLLQESKAKLLAKLRRANKLLEAVTLVPGEPIDLVRSIKAHLGHLYKYPVQR